MSQFFTFCFKLIMVLIFRKYLQINIYTFMYDKYIANNITYKNIISNYFDEH